MLSPKVLGIAVARYDFCARDMRELSLLKGDVVKIYTKMSGNGWWRGEANGKVSSPSRALVPVNEGHGSCTPPSSCWGTALPRQPSPPRTPAPGPAGVSYPQEARKKNALRECDGGISAGHLREGAASGWDEG